MSKAPQRLRLRETHHSLASISSSPSLSKTDRAWFNLEGTNKYCRFSFPQFARNILTSLFSLTAVIISCFVSVPELSTSIISKTLRAAERNSAENSSSAAAAALARRSCSAFRSAVRFSNPR